MKRILSSGVVQRDPPDAIFNPALYQLCSHPPASYYFAFSDFLLFTAETQRSQSFFYFLFLCALSEAPQSVMQARAVNLLCAVFFIHF
jgi:hypothetical protein